MDRISICDSLLKRNENNPFLKQIITGDKKWIVYICVERKRSWAENDMSHHNRSKGRSASEKGDAVYLVGLEGHCVL